jgi:hypothetical protein
LPKPDPTAYIAKRKGGDRVWDPSRASIGALEWLRNESQTRDCAVLTRALHESNYCSVAAKEWIEKRTQEVQAGTKVLAVHAPESSQWKLSKYLEDVRPFSKEDNGWGYAFSSSREADCEPIFVHDVFHSSR